MKVNSIVEAPGNLREYPTGLVEKVMKEPGLEFSMGFLVRSLLGSPMAYQVGSVYVQTVTPGVDRALNPGGDQYYFDDEHCIRYDGPDRIGLAWLDKFPIDEPKHAITIGKRWNSPLGHTGIVDAVVFPWDRGYFSDDATKGIKSPTAAGRLLLDRIQKG